MNLFISNKKSWNNFFYWNVIFNFFCKVLTLFTKIFNRVFQFRSSNWYLTWHKRTCTQTQSNTLSHTHRGRERERRKQQKSNVSLRSRVTLLANKLSTLKSSHSTCEGPLTLYYFYIIRPLPDSLLYYEESPIILNKNYCLCCRDFQRRINKTWCLSEDKFITEETMARTWTYMWFCSGVVVTW